MIAVVIVVVVVAAVVVILRAGGHTTLVPNFSSQPEGDRARKKDGTNFSNLKNIQIGAISIEEFGSGVICNVYCTQALLPCILNRIALHALARLHQFLCFYGFSIHFGADPPGSPRIPLGESPPRAGSP